MVPVRHQYIKPLNPINYIFLIILIMNGCRSSSHTSPESSNIIIPDIPSGRWYVSNPILEAGPEHSFDEISVKDPSIVYYNGKYHLFYTGKATYETRDSLKYLSKNGSGLGYVSAPSLKELAEAKRFDMGALTGSVIVAPQVFYFEPQGLWYIIAQTIVDGKPDLMPVYLTNPDIEDVCGWSEPSIIQTNKSTNGFWIDFWVICDDQKAHLFYTDHEGSLFRIECPLEQFPSGFKNEREETVLTVRGENESGRWRLHEASHIYYVRAFDHYFNILEAVYPHPTRKNYWDSRNRFVFGMVAKKLEGPWFRVEPAMNTFLGDPSNLFNLDGSLSKYDQVSHPELIRAGYNQKLEIEDYDLQILFQAFDAETTGSDYDYNYLPWKLLVMKNF